MYYNILLSEGEDSFSYVADTPRAVPIALPPTRAPHGPPLFILLFCFFFFLLFIFISRILSYPRVLYNDGEDMEREREREKEERRCVFGSLGGEIGRVRVCIYANCRTITNERARPIILVGPRIPQALRPPDVH